MHLRDLLQSVLLLLDRQLKDQSVAVERKLEEDVSIQGFPGELRQVFTNLITNGRKRQDRVAGCEFYWRTRHPADSKAGATVTITDSGPGILESHLNKIFKPFFTTKGDWALALASGSAGASWKSMGERSSSPTAQIPSFQEQRCGSIFPRLVLPR